MDRRREELTRRRRLLEAGQSQPAPVVAAPRGRLERTMGPEDAAPETADDEQARQVRARLPGDDAASTPPSGRVTLRRNLATRGALRQAIVLSEILGPPKALRRGEDE